MQAYLRFVRFGTRQPIVAPGNLLPQTDRLRLITCRQSPEVPLGVFTRRSVSGRDKQASHGGFSRPFVDSRVVAALTGHLSGQVRRLDRLRAGLLADPRSWPSGAAARRDP